MLTPSIILAVAWLQQPGPETPAARAARQAAFDTSTATLTQVGTPVAEVRSALDVYRRAVFNGTDAEVLTNSQYLWASCRAVDSVARVAEKKLCRRCAARDVQAAFDSYRQGLPSLSRGTARCAMQLGRLANGRDAAKLLRRDVRDIGNALILTLRSYEARLAVVRQALNLTGASPIPQRPAGPPHR
jgi:hypothetical protein